MIAAGAVALWTRLIPLSNSLSTAEIHSIVNYVRPGPSGIWSSYTTGDHPLYGLLSWITTAVFGDHGSIGYRFWSVAPALAGAALLTLWAWHRLGPWVAAAFAVIVATAPQHMLLSATAGGYGLGYLASALLVIAVDELSRAPTRRALAVFVIAGLIGMSTLIAFVFPFLATAVILGREPDLRRRIVYATGAALALSLLWYAPVLGDLVGLQLPPSALALPWHGFLTHPLSDQLAPSAQLIAPGLSLAAADAITGTLLVVGAVLLRRREQGMLAMLMLAPAFATYAVFEAARLEGAPTSLSFVQLPLLAMCAYALAELGLLAATRGRIYGTCVAVGATALSLFAFHRADAFFNRTADVPMENWKQTATFAQQAGTGIVFTNTRDASALAYYVGRSDVARVSGLAGYHRLCLTRGPIAYLQDSRADSPPSFLACLVRRGATRIPLQAAVPMTLWLAADQWPTSSASGVTRSRRSGRSRG